MSIYPVALAVIAAVEAVLLSRRWVVPWWRRRREYTDECEVCGKALTRRTVRELREDIDDGLIEVGGTAMIATFCRRHYPK